MRPAFYDMGDLAVAVRTSGKYETGRSSRPAAPGRSATIGTVRVGPSANRGLGLPHAEPHGARVRRTSRLRLCDDLYSLWE